MDDGCTKAAPAGVERLLAEEKSPVGCLCSACLAGKAGAVIEGDKLQGDVEL